MITDAPQAPTLLVEGTYEIHVERLSPAEDNIRANDRLGDLTSLAASIVENGVLQPLLVTTEGLIACGHRRRAAAILATEVAPHRAMVPCVVRAMTRTQRVKAMLAENLDREDLTVMEEARGYQLLLDVLEEGDHKTVATLVGVRATRVKERLELVKLPKAVTDRVEQGSLPIADALALTRLIAYPRHMKRVVAQISKGRHHDLAYLVQQALGSVDRAKRMAEAKGKLPAGVKVIEWKGVYVSYGDLAIVGPAESSFTGNRVNIRAKGHANLTCRVVALKDDGTTVEFCSSPSNHEGYAPAATRPQQSSMPDYEARQALRVAWAAVLEQRHEARLGLASSLLDPDEKGPGIDRFVARELLRHLHLDEIAVLGVLGVAIDDDAELEFAYQELDTQIRRRPGEVIRAIAFVLAEDALMSVFDPPFAGKHGEGARAWFDFLGERGYVPVADEVALRAVGDGPVAEVADPTEDDE